MEFQDAMYSGGKLRIQSIEDMGQNDDKKYANMPGVIKNRFVNDSDYILRDDNWYEKQLIEANEPYEILHTYPYEPRMYECWPTRDRKFENRLEYNKWAAEDHPDRVCPPEFRRKVEILNVESTTESSDDTIARDEVAPDFGFATRKTRMSRRRSIDLTLHSVKRTEVSYYDDDSWKPTEDIIL